MATLRDLQKYLGYEFSSSGYIGKTIYPFKTSISTTFVVYVEKTTGNLYGLSKVITSSLYLLETKTIGTYTYPSVM